MSKTNRRNIQMHQRKLGNEARFPEGWASPEDRVAIGKRVARVEEKSASDPSVSSPSMSGSRSSLRWMKQRGGNSALIAAWKTALLSAIGTNSSGS